MKSLMPALEPNRELPLVNAEETASPRPLIRLRGLWKTYVMGEMRVNALRGVDFDLRDGEFVAIMGASGSGKSTFMNLLGCLDRPTSGQYWLGGIDVGTLDKEQLAHLRNLRFGFVFQGFNLLPRTSAIENVELPALYAHIPADERARRAREALRIVGLEGREKHFPGQLSGGQQQRVAIARALVNRPSILLADEPTGNLDSRTSVEIMELFQRLNRGDEEARASVTVVLVTHESDIARFARRVVTFRDGRILRDQRNAAPDDATEVLARMPAVKEDVA